MKTISSMALPSCSISLPVSSVASLYHSEKSTFTSSKPSLFLSTKCRLARSITSSSSDARCSSWAKTLPLRYWYIHFLSLLLNHLSSLLMVYSDTGHSLTLQRKHCSSPSYWKSSKSAICLSSSLLFQSFLRDSIDASLDLIYRYMWGSLTSSNTTHRLQTEPCVSSKTITSFLFSRPTRAKPSQCWSQSLSQSLILTGISKRTW